MTSSALEIRSPTKSASFSSSNAPEHVVHDDCSNAIGVPMSIAVLMDEVHNLVCPSAEILRNPKRMLMLQVEALSFSLDFIFGEPSLLLLPFALQRLRQLLRTAENSVVIGLSGTPLSDQPGETSALLGLIKGRCALCEDCLHRLL